MWATVPLFSPAPQAKPPRGQGDEHEISRATSITSLTYVLVLHVPWLWVEIGSTEVLAPFILFDLSVSFQPEEAEISRPFCREFPTAERHEPLLEPCSQMMAHYCSPFIEITNLEMNQEKSFVLFGLPALLLRHTVQEGDHHLAVPSAGRTSYIMQNAIQRGATHGILLTVCRLNLYNTEYPSLSDN